MTTTIALASQKGGVGKTTTTLNLGAALAAAGRSVLLVDLDPQAALTVALLGEEATLSETNVYRALMQDGHLSLHTWIRSEVRPHLDILTSTIDLAGAEVELLSEIGREHVLRERLQGTPHDYVLIDCPPSLGLLTLNALCASHFVLIPVQTQMLAYRGMSLLLHTVDRVRQRANPGLRVLGILPTIFDQRRLQDREVLEALRAHYGASLLDLVIPTRAVVADAVVATQTVLELSPASDAAARYRTLAKLVEEKTDAH